MSEKPDKLIPRLFRFTADDIRKIGEIREWYAMPSDASVMRRALMNSHWDVVREKHRFARLNDEA
jgi:hypothetical protein